MELKEKRLLDTRELMEYVSIGRNNAMQWGAKIGAKRNFGKRVLYDRIIVDRAIDAMASAADSAKQ